MLKRILFVLFIILFLIVFMFEQQTFAMVTHPECGCASVSVQLTPQNSQIDPSAGQSITLTATASDNNANVTISGEASGSGTGSASANWDGKNGNTPVADGTYTFSATADMTCSDCASENDCTSPDCYPSGTDNADIEVRMTCGCSYDGCPGHGSCNSNNCTQGCLNSNCQLTSNCSCQENCSNSTTQCSGNPKNCENDGCGCGKCGDYCSTDFTPCEYSINNNFLCPCVFTIINNCSTSTFYIDITEACDDNNSTLCNDGTCDGNTNECSDYSCNCFAASFLAGPACVCPTSSALCNCN
jgi:hypothetical protein